MLVLRNGRRVGTPVGGDERQEDPKWVRDNGKRRSTWQVSETSAGLLDSELCLALCNGITTTYCLHHTFTAHKAFAHIFINSVSLKWLAPSHTWRKWGLVTPSPFLFSPCHNSKYSTTSIRSHYFHDSTDGIYHTIRKKSSQYHKGAGKKKSQHILVWWKQNHPQK